MARPLFPWLGNKEKLIPFILQMIPHDVQQYMEVFGGSAAVILGMKAKKARLDIYNDLNDDLFNVFCCVKEKPISLSRELGFLPVHGRTAFSFYRDIVSHEPEFYRHIEEEKALLSDRSLFSQKQAEELLRALNGRAKLFDVHRAAAFLMTRYGSFSGTGNSVGIKPIDANEIIERLPQVVTRLQSIVLEHQDAIDLIVKRDRSNGVIYADPPYVNAESCYLVDFPTENHILLRDALRNCKGFTILSYNNCSLVWDLYREAFFIFSLKRENPLAQTEGATYNELIITNFDPRPLMNHQMDLFTPSPTSKWELVLLNTPHHILKTL